jgi:hypothetical protein
VLAGQPGDTLGQLLQLARASLGRPAESQSGPGRGGAGAARSEG